METAKKSGVNVSVRTVLKMFKLENLSKEKIVIL